MDYRDLAKDKLVWGLGALLVPGLIGWGMALFSVVNDLSSTGNQIARACSLPIALQIGQAIDGEWAPLLVSVLGTLLIAGGLFAMWNPAARSTITAAASSGREYATSILAKENASDGRNTKPALSVPGTGASTTKARIFKVIGLFGGGFLTIFGSFLAWFAWVHRPIEDSLAGATDALFNRGLGMDGWVFHEGPFFAVMGIGIVAIVLGAVSFTASLVFILWKRI